MNIVMKSKFLDFVAGGLATHVIAWVEVVEVVIVLLISIQKIT